MSIYTTNLSNLSYTNKDFNTIYPELLELADKISYKWQPSASNESDPGVVLLKLNALMADKLNYNIDKNILELFPVSVTQDPNAREIFEQCGYTMKYYRSASTKVTLTMYKKPDNLDGSVSDGIGFKLPRFFMLSDVDNETVYTVPNLSEEVTLSPVEADGTTRSVDVDALQGTALDFTINGAKLITYSDLDYNNRLYFNELNIAENGIFIQNVKSGEGQHNYSDWKKVNNLMVQELGTSCYKFGVSRDAKSCYIEFPTDIANLIGEGLYIKYIATNGYQGNIASNTLSQFFGNVEAKVLYAAGESNEVVQISTATVDIRNSEASFDGADPETIDEAYKNYERTKGTFDTLVSLRDYTNFLKTSGEVSNGFVCDRTNDIQSSYKIISTDGDIQRLIPKQHLAKVRKEIYVEDGTSEKIVSGYQYEPELNAVQLRLYGMTHIPALSSTSHNELTTQFNLSFQPVGPLNSIPFINICEDIEDVKSIKHDFADICDSRILNIILEYPIHAKIIPYTKLTSLQEVELYRNIYRSIFNEFNSSQLEYGKEIDYDKLYQTILNSDNRIKTIILQELSYTAKALYYSRSRDTIVSITLSDTNPDAEDAELRENFKNEIRAKSILAGATPFIDQENKFTYSVQQDNPQIFNSVGTITTEARIKPESTKVEIKIDDMKKEYYKYSISDNENIVLTRPSLITFDKYQTMFCIHNIADYNKFRSGDSIELQPGQYIALFSKAASAANIKCYLYYNSMDHGRSAHTTFTWSDDSTCTLAECYYGNNLDDIWEIGPGIMATRKDLDIAIRDYINRKDSNFIDDIIIIGDTASFNDYLKVQNTSLSWDGIKKILVNAYGAYVDIQEANSITLNQQSDCNQLYWILNKSENNRYVLFEPNIDSYTLQTGEYLYYSNPQSSVLNVVEAGTVIKRSDTLNSWAVDAISADEIYRGGIKVLDANRLWFKLSSSDEITITEQEFYILDSTSALYLPDNPELTNSVLERDEAAYFDPSEKTVIMLPKIIGGNSEFLWKCRSRLNLVANTAKPQHLEFNSQHKHYICLINEYTINSIGIGELTRLEEAIWLPSDPNSNNLNLCDSYIQTHLPVELIGGENISSIHENLVGARQGIDLYVYTRSKNTDTNNKPTMNVENSDFSTKHTLTVTALNDNKNVEQAMPKYPSCSTSFNLPQGDFIIPLITGVAGSFTAKLRNTAAESLQDIEVYGSKHIDEIGVHYIKFTRDIDQSSNPENAATISIEWRPNIFRKGDDSIYLTGVGTAQAPYLIASDCVIMIPPNETRYIKNNRSTGSELKFSDILSATISNSTDITRIRDNSIQEFHNTTSITQYLTLTYEFEKKTSIIFKPVVKYTRYLEDALFEKLETLIDQYDYDNEFDYTYKVPEEVKISDPLDPKAFLESNHPFNRCTMCKALIDPKNDTILLTNKA